MEEVVGKREAGVGRREDEIMRREVRGRRYRLASSCLTIREEGRGSLEEVGGKREAGVGRREDEGLRREVRGRRYRPGLTLLNGVLRPLTSLAVRLVH